MHVQTLKCIQKICLYIKNYDFDANVLETNTLRVKRQIHKFVAFTLTYTYLSLN